MCASLNIFEGTVDSVGKVMEGIVVYLISVMYVTEKIEELFFFEVIAMVKV